MVPLEVGNQIVFDQWAITNLTYKWLVLYWGYYNPVIRSPLILSSFTGHPSGVYGPVKVLVEIPGALKDGNKSLEGSLESWGRKPWPQLRCQISRFP